ncbi:MAG TPA: IS200/IS605 family transposase [Candidatus Sulfotelmatobacter sp.]|nr:IS200/IS605 family transposase [Candidatus Sulfotelmatobacter sp.]
MSHTYTANIVHCVFSTKQRAPMIPADRQEHLWAYFLGIARNLKIKILAIGGVADHLHLLIALLPTMNLAKVICDLKANSSRWLNETGGHFAWQDGYAAFSVSPSRIGDVQRYIRNQAEHHKKRNFEEEFVDLLRKSGIPFEEKCALG